LNEDQLGDSTGFSKSSMKASACVFARMRVPLFAQTPVVGIPPLDDPLLLEELLPLEEPLPLEELLPLEEPLLLEELLPLEEPVPLDDPLPLAPPSPGEPLSG
jgi:hypothetical protein